MSVALVNRCDVLVRVESAPSTELVALLDALFDLAGHQFDSLSLREGFTLCCFRLRSQLGHPVYSLLVRSIQAISVEYFPTVGLFGLSVALAFPAAHLLFSLDGCLKKVLFLFVDAFGLEVALLQPQVFEELLLGHLSLVLRVCQPLLLLKHSLIVQLHGLVNLELEFSFAPFESREATLRVLKFGDLLLSALETLRCRWLLLLFLLLLKLRSFFFIFLGLASLVHRESIVLSFLLAVNFSIGVLIVEHLPAVKDVDRDSRPVCHVCGNFGDLPNRVHSLDDLPEDDVFAV